MTLMTLAKQLEQLAADNSPAILTGIGVTGTVATAILTGKASIKAARLIDESEAVDDLTIRLATSEKVRMTWKLYIPAAGCCVLTVASIITANQIGTRRAAAMAAAYGLSERAFERYKDQVKEKFGEAKERDVRDDLAQKQVRENPPQENTVLVTASGDVLCLELFTGRYFRSDIESIKKAQNDLNYRLLSHGYASLSEFYDFLGLQHTQVSDDLGWSSDKMLEISFSGALTTDDKPCMVLDYQVGPREHYFKTH